MVKFRDHGETVHTKVPIPMQIAEAVGLIRNE